MKSVVIIKVPNTIKCADYHFNVNHNLSAEELKKVLQTVSPRFEISCRRYYPGMDSDDFVDITKAMDIIKKAELVAIDRYNYEEIDSWHLVEDGVFTYEKFKKGTYKVSEGKLYVLKKIFQRCPLKITYRNVGDGTWKTIEKL